jgi:hypothetical protein
MSGSLTYKARKALESHSVMISAKLEELCRCHGVSPQEVNLDLIVRLARRHVPGFQVAGTRLPRRPKWNDFRLARLWKEFRNIRGDFDTDKSALAYIAAQSDFCQITGDVKFVWVKQMLERAKRSPLVQLMESSNKLDREFAQRFLASHE